MKYVLIYLLIVNALAFLLMLIDKIKARKNRWRIPEATLMLMAAVVSLVIFFVGDCRKKGKDCR